MSEKYHFFYTEFSKDDCFEARKLVMNKMKYDRIVSVFGIFANAATCGFATISYFESPGPLSQVANLVILGLSLFMFCCWVLSLLRKCKEKRKFLESLEDENTFIDAFEKELKKACTMYDRFYEKAGTDTSGYIVQSEPLFEESFSNIRKLWFSILSQYDLSADIIRFFEDRIAHMESNEQKASTLIYLEVLKEQLQSGNMLILDSIESGNGLANYKCEEVEMP